MKEQHMRFAVIEGEETEVARLKAEVAEMREALRDAQECLCQNCGTSYRIIQAVLDKQEAKADGK
jgi:hypothetical protein